MRRGPAVVALGVSLMLALSPLAPQVRAGEQALLQLPEGAVPRSQRETVLGTYALPIGAFGEGGIPTRVIEGHILRQTWHLQGDVTVLQVVDVLRRQLADQGFDLLFQCETRQCGGFDFRFGIEVVPAPDMVVSLSDYHFLAAQMPVGTDTVSEARRTLSLLVSRSGATTYIQLIEVAPAKQAPLTLSSAEQVASDLQAATEPEPTRGETTSGLAGQLTDQGHVVLEAVVFNTGAETLGAEAIASLAPLADFLEDEPKAQVLIVGHTDSVGSLEDNKSLSLRRAQAVKEALVQSYAISEERVLVEGAGFMAPVASNLSAAGREKNRRVEVVLLVM